MNKQPGSTEHPRPRNGWELLAGVLAFVYVGTMIVMFQADLKAVHEPSLLLPILNTIFAALIPLGVSIIAARAYLSSGLKNLLFMGCGMMAFGCGALSAGWLIGGQQGPNANVTIYNTGALLASLFHAYGALLHLKNKIPEAMPGRRSITMVMAYAGILLAVSALTLATLSGATPQFFVQGAGPTIFRQFVLGTAIVLYLLSALVAMRVFTQGKNSFHYWYSLSLAMIALGLTAFFLQSAVGSPIGWLGRAGQYIGGVYALIAVLVVFNTARVDGVSVRNAMAAVFQDSELAYRALVETAADPIILFEQDGAVIQWNAAAEAVFGYRESEALGSSLPDLIVDETFIGIFRQEVGNLKVISESMKVGLLLEIAGKTKDQGVVPVEVSISAMKAGGRWICIGVFKDVSKRKKAQDALEISIRELARSNTVLEQRVAERTTELQQELAERKRMQEALQETQVLLTRAEEIGKLGGWEFDIDTMQQTWTKAVYAIHEVDFTDQPTVEQGISFYTPESRPIIELAVQRAIEQNEPFDLELEIITAKGNLRAVHTIGRHDPVRGKIVGFFQDITERKQAEAHRLESEKKRRSEQAAALEVQRQAGIAALSLMEDTVAARKQAEAMSTALAEQLDELRRWQQVTLGREGRVLAMKKEVNNLLAERGQPPRYASAADAETET